MQQHRKSIIYRTEYLLNQSEFEIGYEWTILKLMDLLKSDMILKADRMR